MAVGMVPVAQDTVLGRQMTSRCSRFGVVCCLAFSDTEKFWSRWFLSFSLGGPVKVCLRVLFGLIRVTRGRISLGVFPARRCSSSVFVTVLGKHDP